MVQTYIANKVTQKINQKFGTSIHIDRLGLNWKGEIDIRDLYIEDHHQDTLIYSKKLVTNLLSVTHLANGKLDFGFIELHGPKFYLKTYQNERLDNISIFAKLFVTDTLRKKSSFRLNADRITLNKGNVKITNDNFSTSEIFNLSKVTIDTDNFSLIGPTVKFEVNRFTSNFTVGPIRLKLSVSIVTFDKLKISLVLKLSFVIFTLPLFKVIRSAFNLKELFFLKVSVTNSFAKIDMLSNRSFWYVFR